MPQQFLQQRIKRTTMMSVVCIGILLGIAAVQWGFFVGGAAVWIVALAMVFVSIWKLRAVLLPAILVAGVLLGSLQATAFVQTLRPYDGLRGQKIAIEGVVNEDPTYSDKGNRQFFVTAISVKGQKLPGQVFVSTPLSADVRRHDKVAVVGTLRDGFGQFQGSVYFAKVTKIGETQHAVDVLRSQFASSVSAVLPEPHASLGLGFVIGMKSALPSDLEDALRDLSLTHVVVASGYNLTILVRAAKRLREKKSKLQTLLLSFGLIGLFLFVTGNSPSMVRAAIVSGLVLLAWYFGRQFKPHFLLLLVMAATALYNPTYLWGDLGWWLSFSAFAGIMIVVPLIVERLWKEDKKPSFLGQIALEAVVAQLMTLPIILLVFGNLSLLGVVANVLVVPLVPFAMLATAIAGFVGMALPVLAAYIAIPAHAVLAVIVSIVKLLSSVPWATQTVFMNIQQVALWYVSVGIVVWALWGKLSHKRRQRALMQQIV